MFIIIHALLGALIGSYFNSFAVIIFLSVVSHFLLDMIPHWDGPFDKEFFQYSGKIDVRKSRIIITSLDLILTILLLLEIYQDFPHNARIFAGAFFAILPDLIGLGYFTGLKNKNKYMGFLKFHSKIQKDTWWVIGIVTQLIIAIIIAKILF